MRPTSPRPSGRFLVGATRWCCWETARSRFRSLTPSASQSSPRARSALIKPHTRTTRGFSPRSRWQRRVGEEWLAVYVVGMCTITTCPEGSTLWLYSCGDQSCSPSTSSGSTLTFGSGPPDEHNRPEDEWPLAAEGYEMVLLLATGSAPPYQIIASVGFTVDPPVTTAITDANRDTCCRASNMGTTGPLPLNRVLSNPTVR